VPAEASQFAAKLLDLGMQSGRVVDPVERRPPSSAVPTSTSPATERKPALVRALEPPPGREPALARAPEPPPEPEPALARAPEPPPEPEPALARAPEPPAIEREPPTRLADAGPEVRMGVSPCLPPPPADSVIPWESLPAFEVWEQLVGRIRESDEFLAAVLGDVGLVSLSAGVLRVAAPRGSFAHTELGRNPQRRAQVDQATRDHLGAPFALELVEGAPSLPELPSLDLVVKKRRAEHRAQVEAEAKAHPGIQAILHLFDGQLAGTKPLHEP
jgi:DNA polymerase-3 subunit gamma/tau